MFLDAIVGAVDERVQRLTPVSSFLRQEAERMPPVRSLRAALSGQGLAIIAECKQKSPSKGWLTDYYDPQAQALRYQKEGAAAISVLTEPHFFAGDLSHLQAVRDLVSVPVLRKDFVRHPVQLFEARMAGADAVLLIVRIVDQVQLRELYETANGIGLEVLVEIHSAAEAERALAVNPEIIGVNNRDLDTFETRLDFSREMADVVPKDIIRVSESGISHDADLTQVKAWGYQAALVGESLMRGKDLLRVWADGHHN
ncbi:MAG: indole-3-glycerol phosphate synthase TrpC [Sulfobacillus acidophilus]|uniref:Indole-3-glycerol phosphate synthase n=1 Tax=Sulfobacillus acidophilus TaxID=53633 RepID=A0A2T2WDS4_9FIRM|nr:MAG: indole-3-glycerol phosphate synthase TrpC [Sulfobacillus acidophilus]